MNKEKEIRELLSKTFTLSSRNPAKKFIITFSDAMEGKLVKQ